MFEFKNIFEDVKEYPVKYLQYGNNASDSRQDAAKMNTENNLKFGFGLRYGSHVLYHQPYEEVYLFDVVFNF